MLAALHSGVHLGSTSAHAPLLVAKSGKIVEQILKVLVIGLYKELVSKTSYIHFDMLLICIISFC